MNENYRILGLKAASSEEQIEERFHILMKKLHVSRLEGVSQERIEADKARIIKAYEDIMKAYREEGNQHLGSISGLKAGAKKLFMRLKKSSLHRKQSRI